MDAFKISGINMILPLDSSLAEIWYLLNVLLIDSRMQQLAYTKKTGKYTKKLHLQQLVNTNINIKLMRYLEIKQFDHYFNWYCNALNIFYTDSQNIFFK